MDSKILYQTFKRLSLTLLTARIQVSSFRQLRNCYFVLVLCASLIPAGAAADDSEISALEALRQGQYVRLNGMFGEYDLSHAGIIWSIDVSKDGKYAVTGSADRAAKLWNLQTRTEVRAFIGHDSDVTSVALSPDASRLLSGSKDGTVRIWDVATGQQLATLEGHEDWVLAVAFSPDGKTAASAGRDKVIFIWDIVSGKAIAQFKGHTGFVSSLEFSTDGSKLLSSSYDQSVRLWDMKTLSPGKIFLSNQGWLLTASFGNNGRSVLASAADNIILEWRIDSGLAEAKYVGHEGWVYSIITVPGSSKFFSASLDGTIRSWRYGESDPDKVLVDAEMPINDAVLAQDRGSFLVASGSKVRIYDVATGKERAADRQGHIGPVRAVVAVAGGKELASAGADGKIIVWEAKSHKELRRFSTEAKPRGGYMALSYSRSGDILAAGTEDGAVLFFDYKNGELEYSTQQHEAAVTDLKYSPDGRYLVSASADHTFALLKVKNGIPVEKSSGVLDYLGKAFFQAFGKHKGRVNSIDISPDSSRIVSGSNDGAIRLWDADREQWLHTYREHRSGVSAVRFYGKRLEVLSGAISGVVRLMNLGEGQKERTFAGHKGAVVAIALGQGHKMYTASVDSSIRVWAIDSGRELQTIDLRGVTDLPQSMFVSDSKLYVGTLRGVILDFDLTSPVKGKAKPSKGRKKR
ncbi:MAG: WD40 repeat domain-containing protein [Bdellovibrionales bacterium]|nr:WD40 repeat domain-containing protein [Bdellovibrionales bacterium]